MKDFKYNYIVCGDKGFYEVAYYDIMQLDNIVYFSSPIDGLPNRFLRCLARFNYSHKINNYVYHPFDFLINPYLYVAKFCNNKPICYVVFFQSLRTLTCSYFVNLKKNNPSCKIVVYFQDIIASRKNFDLNAVRQFADLLITYDEGDAVVYNMKYYPTPFSIYNVEDNPNILHSDVYFTGYAKTRYHKVFEVYEKCREQGLKCDFNLIAVPKNKRIYENDINYDRRISYYENLQHVVKTRCILEIMQEGATGYTPRLWESIVYDKHLLTNNIAVKNSKMGSYDAIHFLDELKDVRFMHSEVSYSKDIKKSLSPINLFYFIDKNIC